MSDRLLFSEFEMPFRQFQADREVQAVFLTLRHWGGETVRGDLSNSTPEIHFSHLRL